MISTPIYKVARMLDVDSHVTVLCGDVQIEDDRPAQDKARRTKDRSKNLSTRQSFSRPEFIIDSLTDTGI